MPSYYPLENWDGSGSAQDSLWSQQTNGRTPVPVAGQHGDGKDGAPPTESDKKLVVDHVDDQDELIVNHVEGSQISSVFPMTSGNQNVRLIGHSTSASIASDISGLVEVDFGLNASMCDTFDERVGDHHQRMLQKQPQISRPVTDTQIFYAAQTFEPSDHLSDYDDVSGKPLVGSNIESGMDVEIPANFNDITRIFDNDIDVINAHDHTRDSVQAPEEYHPITIETNLSWTHAVDSPASLDIPTDIFHTPSRSDSESRDSLVVSTTFPSPSSAPVRRRVVMSHIAVPPFPRGTNLKEYQPLPRHKKLRPIRPDIQTHMSMSEALQAAMNNNGALHTISSQKRIMAENRADSVASSRPATRVVKNKEKFGGTTETEKEKEKQRDRKREDENENAAEIVPYQMDASEKEADSVAASVLSFVSTRHPSHRLQRREFGYTTYVSELDLVHLTVCGIPYDPRDIVSANTRFLCETKRVLPTAEIPRGRYSTKADTDDYGYTQKWSSSCESLEGIEEALSAGEFWLDVDGSGAEEWEEVIVQQEEEEDEIMICFGRSGSSQPQRQSLPEKVETKAAMHTGVPNRAIRVGTPSVDDDDMEIADVSFAPKQTKLKEKPKTRLRTGSSMSSLGQVRSHGGANKSLVKPGERGQGMFPPEVPHPPRLRTILQESVRTQPQQTLKRLCADNDEEEHWSSAKATGKRRAMSPGSRDTSVVQCGRPPLSPSLSKVQSEPVKKVKTPEPHKSSSKASELVAMADMINSTMKSHPLPSQSLSDQLASPLPFFSPNHSASTPHLTKMTAETLYVDHSLTPSASQVNPTFDSTVIMDSSSDFLEQHTSASSFLPDAVAIESPFLAEDPYFLESPTGDFRFSSPENQIESNGNESGLFPWNPENGTIDPSLLEGNLSEKQEHSILSPSSQVASSAYLSLVAYDSNSSSPLASPPPQSPPRSLQLRPASTSRRSLSPSAHSPPYPFPRSISSSPQQRLGHLASNNPPTSGHHSNGPASPAPSASYTVTRSSRVPKHPRLPDGMIETANLHLEGDSDGESGSERPKKKIRARRIVRPRTYAAGDATSESEYEEGPSSQSKTIVMQKRPVSAVSNPKSKKSYLSHETDWLRDPQEDYCHQCRSRTFYRKYICACTKRYCIRCLSLRKRGEEYVSLRKSKANKLPLDTSVTRVVEKKRAPQSVVPRVTRRPPGGKTNLPAPIIPGPVQYWATIYGIDGGRIGNAFVGNGNEGLVLPHFLWDPSYQKSQPRNRIFIGETQESWGLGDEPFVKDLDPVPWYERNNGPNERMYVGAKASLTWLSCKRPKTSVLQHEGPPPFDIRSSSPLSSLNESEGGNDGNELETAKGESHRGHEMFLVEADPEAAVQEDIDGFVVKSSGHGFSADSLGDSDVVRAISRGLTACGMTVQLSSS